MLQNCLFVMVGGALGALMRYGVGRLCAGVTSLSMPAGTLIVNVVGCFILGALTALGEHHAGIPKPLLLLLTTGMCGAFTTFSTFSSETVRMMEGGQWPEALLYVVTSIVAGFLMFWAGKSI